MQIYILRHGVAEAASLGMSDADRTLVLEGRKKLRAVLKLARETGVEPTQVRTSPYRRAVETAEMVAGQLSFPGEIIKVNALRPGCGPAEAWEEIRLFPAESRILVCGHEPLLGYLIGFLLSTPSLLIDLKKGSLVRIDLDRLGPQPRGVLKWYLTPKLALACT